MVGADGCSGYEGQLDLLITSHGKAPACCFIGIGIGARCCSQVARGCCLCASWHDDAAGGWTAGRSDITRMADDEDDMLMMKDAVICPCWICLPSKMNIHI